MKNTIQEYAALIDHTNLSNVASEDDIKRLCDEAKEYGFKSVCINPCYVSYAKALLQDTNVLVCTVVGFPLGMNSPLVKVAETINAIKDGADEIDMVLNQADFKAGDIEKCIKEINAIKNAIGDKTLKVIVETSSYNAQEIIDVMKMINESNADFIKTSTGFIGSGAKVEDILAWKKIIHKDKKIKASGGIRTTEDFLKFVEAGADRIGASKSIEIMKGLKE